MRKQGFVGLVLKHDGQLEGVAEVEEAGRGGPHHKGQTRGEIRFTGPEVFAAGDGYDHHAVAGQVVGQCDGHTGLAVLVGPYFGGKEGQGVEVQAEANRRRPVSGRAPIFGHLFFHCHVGCSSRGCHSKGHHASLLHFGFRGWLGDSGR